MWVNLVRKFGRKIGRKIENSKKKFKINKFARLRACALARLRACALAQCHVDPTRIAARETEAFRPERAARGAYEGDCS